MEETPNPYLLQRLDGFQDSIIRLDQKIDTTMGDHATRIARAETRLDNHDESNRRHDREHREMMVAFERFMSRGTAARRWIVATVIAASAAVAGVVVAIMTAIH